MKTILIILTLMFFTTFSYSGVHSIEKGEEGYEERMIELLNENPDYVIAHVKGLVCSSCAIGIRVKLSKIDGLDKDIFTKGIRLDTSNQYVTLAAKEKLDFDLIFEKICDAGYEPIHLCYYDENHNLKNVDFIN